MSASEMVMAPRHAEEADAYLVVVEGPSTGELHLLARDQGELIIGRDETAHVRLKEWSVSRLHAVLRRDHRGLLLEDLGSANGTWCNGVHVIWEQVVRDGDRIRFGTVTVLVVDGTPW